MFFKMVAVSIFFAALSLVLFLAASQAPESVVYIYLVYTFIIIAGISFFVAGTITEPLSKLKAGFEALMAGKSIHIDVRTGDELEDLAKAFNYMADVITEQKDKIKRSEEKYKGLVEEINDWVFELDDKLNFTYSSPKVEELLGYSVNEVLNKNLRDFTEVEIKEPEKSLRIELKFKSKDGKEVVMETSLKPFFEEGVLKGYKAVSRDISERKRAENELNYLASIIRHTVDAVISLDSEGRIIGWNRGAELSFGYSKKDVLGKHFSFLLKDVDEWSKYFLEAEKSGHVRFESSGLTSEGKEIKIDVILAKINDRFTVIARDITDRTVAEEKLRSAYLQLEEKTRELIKSRKELEYLANIVENSSDAIYSVNLKGEITSWNRTAERIFGYSKEEAIGMHADNLLPEDLRGETELILRKIMDGITSMSYETKRMTKDGKIVDVEVTISPVYSPTPEPEPEIAGFSVIARDITMKIEAESRMLGRVLKYDIERGKVYLVPDTSLALDIVDDFVKCGCNAVVISRYCKFEKDVASFILSEKSYRKNYKAKSYFNDLGFLPRGGTNLIPPNLDEIEKLVVSLPGWNNIILIELDYLIMKNGFDKVFEFVQRLRDTVYIFGKGIVILTLDESITDEKEYKLIAKECESVKLKVTQNNLSAKCYEILRYTYMQNRVGENVSFRDLMDVFELSRNTVKKYVRQLESMGLVKVVKDGRFKMVVLTDKGKELFSDYGYEYC